MCFILLALFAVALVFVRIIIYIARRTAVAPRCN
jgi:hypothetical protein